jgi:uncharacterized protein YkwD
MRRPIAVVLAAGLAALGASVAEAATADAGTTTHRAAAAAARAPGSDLGPLAAADEAALEARVVELVNEERGKVGCAALNADPRLTAAAQGHSADMAARGYFSHTTPEGVGYSQRITQAGYEWQVAENIAKGYPTAEAVMQGWMTSPGHRANIVECGYVDIGVGVVADPGGTLLWTQDFGRSA